MRPLSDSVTKVTGKTFSRKYVALGRVISHWTDIVGKDFASKAQPVKIQYRYKKKTAQKSNAKKEKPQATLEIATSSADATIMHYQKDVILERINQIFGDAWITAIRFVTTPANSAPRPRSMKKAMPLSADKKNYLSGALSDIQDEEMKARLEKLGWCLRM